MCHIPLTTVLSFSSSLSLLLFSSYIPSCPSGRLSIFSLLALTYVRPLREVRSALWPFVRQLCTLLHFLFINLTSTATYQHSISGSVMYFWFFFFRGLAANLQRLLWIQHGPSPPPALTCLPSIFLVSSSITEVIQSDSSSFQYRSKRFVSQGDNRRDDEIGPNSWGTSSDVLLQMSSPFTKAARRSCHNASGLASL